MTFAQALRYFSREAVFNLFRSWKVTLLAVLTITVSLFLAGAFMLVSSNLETVTEAWRQESALIVYLEPETDARAQEDVRARIEDQRWIAGVDVVSADRAKERFQRTFPGLADLLEGWKEDPLPASLEVRLRADAVEPESYEQWLAQLREDPSVQMVDDDRDWIAQLETVVLVVKGLGLVLGTILLGTAIFTIASIIRLTAYLYRDEIAVMRLVGATEFFIRGPFYMEGLVQGLAGGLLACGGLVLAHAALVRTGSASLLASVLASTFLSPFQIAGLITLGSFAGLIGAITSLRKETLAPESETTWPEP